MEINMATCPNCKKSGIALSLRKCLKCGTVVCSKCVGIKGIGSSCPICKGETKKI